MHSLFPQGLSPAALHVLLESLGMALGAALWRRSVRAQGHSPLHGSTFVILVGLLAGAGLGNKLVFLIERPDVVLQWLAGTWVPAGQSLVGGLLGGLIGVELAKALCGETRSTGDALVWPLAVGIAVGRLGCHLAGITDATHGLPTTFPWGVEQGDGIPRHPVQLMESAFVLMLACVLDRLRPGLDTQPGLRFRWFLTAYLAWRLGIDHLKPLPFDWAWGLSGIQWVCLLALCTYGLRTVRLSHSSLSNPKPLRP